MGDCKKCPFYKTEPVPENLAGKVNLTEWPSCDVDAVGLAAADRIEAQAKEIEKLRRQVPHWIPVEERLPENFRKVLCWGEYFRYGDFNGLFVNYALGYQNNGRWGGEVANGTNARALAWMPLPEPPEVK